MIGTIDILYTVKLKNGDVIQLTSRQLFWYEFFTKYVVRVLWYLFAPVRFFYNLGNKSKGE